MINKDLDKYWGQNQYYNIYNEVENKTLLEKKVWNIANISKITNFILLKVIFILL